MNLHLYKIYTGNDDLLLQWLYCWFFKDEMAEIYLQTLVENSVSIKIDNSNSLP